MSSINVCKNHPEVHARRKCYHCLSPICPECQRRALGHIFCSLKCQLLCWSSDRISGVRRFFLRVSLRYRRLEKSTLKFTGGGLFRLLSIVLLLFLLYQTTILVDTLANMSVPPVPASQQPSLPTADIAHKGDWITVAGSAPDFAVAVLLADGRKRDVTTVSEGRFSFTFQADGDIRIFQVLVYGDSLPAMYSRPILAQAPLDGTEVEASVPEPVEPDTIQPQPQPVEKASYPPPSEPSASSPAKRVSVLKPQDDLTRGLPDTGAVAITFDGGSYSNAAEKILDVLAEKKLKTTFFLTGEFIRRYPKVTRRIAKEGHEVGNHTYSHLHLTTYGKNYRQETLPGVDEDLIRKELMRNEKAFEDLTGRQMVRLWRAPYGEQNKEIRKWALKAGYRHVSWTYDPRTRKSLDGLDWVSDPSSSLYLSSEEIIQKIISFDSDTDLGLAGGIVLLHLGTEREADPFHHRFGELIDKLQEKGYKVGSVGQLLEKGS